MDRSYDLIGAKFGLGSRRAETHHGPELLRAAGLVRRLSSLGADVYDLGDLEGPLSAEQTGHPKAKFQKEVLAFNERLYQKVLQSLRSKRTPVVFGGDHSLSVGSISAAACYLRECAGVEERLGVLWVDAHPDLNTPETTPSGYFHGMSVALLLGRGPAELVNIGGFAPKILPGNVVYIGLRDVDPPERELIKQSGLTAFSMREIDGLGLGAVLERALAHLRRHTDRFIVSFDLDVCDPQVAPGVGTPVRGGFSFRESHYLMEVITEAPELCLIELVEYNGSLDPQGQTSEFAISLLESALGKSIL